MSFLLAVLVPALLMLAALGLSRLEAGLGRDTVTERDVADLPERADTVDVRALVRVGDARGIAGQTRGIERAAQAFPGESVVRRLDVSILCSVGRSG